MDDEPRWVIGLRFDRAPLLAVAAICVATFALAGCAGVPQSPQGAVDARAREANPVHDATNLPQREAAVLRRQIDELLARETDRRLALTLGDLLFAFDSARLKTGTARTLDRLVGFLNQYPDRTVAIEGHTDDVGSVDYNDRLSQRRAGSVKSYLVQQGIAPERLTASGMGQDRPLTSNGSDSGRQQNRRVELIIENASIASAAGG